MGAVATPPRTADELFLLMRDWLTARLGCWSYATELAASGIAERHGWAGYFRLEDRRVQLPRESVARIQLLLDTWWHRGPALDAETLALVRGDLLAMLHESIHAAGPADVVAMYRDRDMSQLPWGRAFSDGVTHRLTLLLAGEMLEATGAAAADPRIRAVTEPEEYYVAEAAAAEVLARGAAAMCRAGWDDLLLRLAAGGYAEAPVRQLAATLLARAGPPATAGLRESHNQAERLAAAVRTGFADLDRAMRTSPNEAVPRRALGHHLGERTVERLTDALVEITRQRQLRGRSRGWRAQAHLG